MPKVEQYQPNQVATQVTQGPRAQSLPAGAFATGLEGIGELGKGIADLTDRIATTEAEEAMVKFEREKNDLMFNPTSGYFNTQGRDAFDGATAVQQSLTDLQKKYSESLGTTAREKFSKVSDAHVTSSTADIMRHASKGQKAWEVATIEASVENTVENAALYWSDPKRMKVQMALGEQSILDASRIQGLPPESTNEKLQTYRSSFAKAAIEAATQQSAEQGKEVREQYSSILEGPDVVKMDKLIEAQEKSEESEKHAQFAVTTAAGLTNQYDEVTDALKDPVIEDLKTSDPELYKTTRSEVSAQFRIKKADEKQKQTDSYDTAIEYINNSKTPAWIKMNDRETWDGMTSTQRNNLLSGKHMLTDQTLLTDLLTLPKAQLSAIDPNDYADQLSPPARQKLTNAVVASRKGESVSRVQTLSAKSKSSAEGIFGSSAKWRTKRGKLTEKGKRANEFLTTLQGTIEEVEADLGRKMKPTEEDALISDYTRQIAIERSAFGFDILASDIELDLSNTPPEDMRVLNRIINNTPGIDPNDLVAAYRFLVDNEQPVNAATLQEVFKQGTR